MSALSHVKSNTIADFTGTVSVYNSAGAITTIAASDLIRPSDWNSVHSIFNTIAGNTSGTSTANGTNLVFGATGGVTVSHSTAAGIATMWISAPPTGYMSEMIYPDHQLTAVTGPVNGSMSLQAIYVPSLLTATKLAITCSISVATTTLTSSAGIVFSHWVGIYTRNGSTLSSVSSASTTLSTFWQSNSTSSITGLRELSIPININMTPGQYVVMWDISTNTAGQTSLGNTMSIYGAAIIQTAAIAPLGVVSATSLGVYRGMGMYSVTTNAVPAAISLSGINATGANQSRANIVLGFYNQ